MGKSIKINKSTLENNDWAELFHCLNKDTQLVAKFLSSARKAKRLPANDLDRILVDIGRKVNSHIVIDTSGSISFQ